MSLVTTLTLTALRNLADTKSFERGRGLFHEGAVGRLEMAEDAVTASVQGTYRYRTSLRCGPSGTLVPDCDCPVGLSGMCCKHVVAVALTWLEMSGEESFPPPDPKKVKKSRRTKADQVADYLATLEAETLRRLLQEACLDDRHLRDKLLFAAKADSATSLTSLRDAVRQATKTAGFIDWQGAYAYAQRLEALATLLGKRIAGGDSGLVEVIEDAISRAEQALEHIDDSDGHVYPAIEHLATVHRAACDALKPDPEALAERLFTLQTEGSWDTFHAILPAYEAALGPRGLTRYGQLVEAEWQALVPLGPARPGYSPWNARRHRLTAAMEALARRSGDVDAVAAVKSKDLSSTGRFLDLARWYREHGRHDDALEWINRGMAAFPDTAWRDLAAFAIEEHLRRGNRDEVERLVWERFARQGQCDDFVLLLSDAGKIERQVKLRQKALDFLWARVAEDEKTTAKPRQTWGPSVRSELLAIYLREGDGDRAWQTLKGGPTSPRLWEPAAALRGKTHPDEAVTLYLKILPDKVQEGARNGRYEAAAKVVKAIRALRLAQGEAARYRGELATIKAEYKSKRNFMAALGKLDS